MSLEVQATYENGVLKLDSPLPLKDQQRVKVNVIVTSVRDSAGLISWQGEPEALEYLMGPENESWDSH